MSNTKCYAPRRAHCRRRFSLDLLHVRRFLKQLVHPISTPAPHYGERQFSFNDTPIFHLPRFSCINPKVEFESCAVDDDGKSDRRRLCGYEVEEEEDGIDLKAEKFIKMFYEEMKMQSQVSYLQFDE